jgi:Cof subfamily protein (haloacid dehalogenase superfamily)
MQPEHEDSEQILREMTEKLFGSRIPVNPFESTTANRPSKADLYDDEELESLWSLHKQLADMKPKVEQSINESDIPALHDVVLEMTDKKDDIIITPPLQTVPNNEWLDEHFRERIANIRAIASDVDGTLLTSSHTIHPRTKLAVQRAVSNAFSPLEKLQWVFPATGKTRMGALGSMGPEIGNLMSQMPGVFIQGLYCVDARGNVVFEQKLSQLALAAAEELARQAQISIVGYDGDNLYTTELSDCVRDLGTKYGEPMPRELQSDLANHEPGMHKVLLMNYDVEKLSKEVRPKLEALAEQYDACVTQAVPTMLEWLPRGCSKAVGVRKLCEALGVDMDTQLLAIGDFENDAAMLQEASIGVAVGNACPEAREAADFLLEETNNDGGAGVAIELFGLGQALE